MSTGVAAKRGRRSAALNSGINIPATLLAVGLFGKLTLPPTESTTAFPAAISKFYDKSAAATAFNLTWELSVNNGAWIRLITTYHQLYLTKNDPALAASAASCADPLPGNLETAFYLACNLSNGKTLDDDIVTSIYNEFTDRRVYGVHKILGDPAGVPLNFWGEPRSEFLGRTGHLLTCGQAVCRGWADFLKQVISIQGISASSIAVKRNSGISGSAEAYGSDLNDGGSFVVKPIIIPPGGVSSSTLPPFYFAGGGAIKIPAQGRPDGNTNWPGHVITRYDSAALGTIYFDPSYGSPLAVGIGSLSAETQYSLGLAGFEGKNLKPFTFGQKRWWQPDPSNLDINFTIAP